MQYYDVSERISIMTFTQTELLHDVLSGLCTGACVHLRMIVYTIIPVELGLRDPGFVLLICLVACYF